MKNYIVTMRNGARKLTQADSPEDAIKRATEWGNMGVSVIEATPENSPENIAISKGEAGLPLRFYDRALCTADELPELLKQGWGLDTSQFAMKPASGL